MFSSPVFLLGATIATLMAAAFHLIAGKGFREAMLYWFASIIGFFLGQVLGSMFFASWPMLGQIAIIPAALLALGGMLVARGLRL